MARVVETLFCTECTECTRCATDTCGSGTKRSRGAPVTLDRESARVTVGSLAGARAGTGSACQAGAAAVFQGSAAPGMLPRPRPAWPSGACSTPRELHAISSPGSSRALIVSCYRQLARRRQDRSSYARISVRIPIEMVGIREAGRAERLLCVRDVGLLAVRVTGCARRVRVNWRAAGWGTWRADVVTVSDYGVILAAWAAGLRRAGRPPWRRSRPAGPGDAGSCRIVAWGARSAGLLPCRARGRGPGRGARRVNCPRPPPYPVWLTTNPWSPRRSA